MLFAVVVAFFLLPGCGSDIRYSTTLELQGLKGEIREIEEITCKVQDDGTVDQSKILEDNVYKYDEAGNLTEHSMNAAMYVTYYENVYEDGVLLNSWKKARSDSVKYKVTFEWDSLGRQVASSEFAGGDKLMVRFYNTLDENRRLTGRSVENLVGETFQPTMIEAMTYGADGHQSALQTMSPQREIRMELLFTYPKNDNSGNWTERWCEIRSSRYPIPEKVFTTRKITYY